VASEPPGPSDLCNSECQRKKKDETRREVGKKRDVRSTMTSMVSVQNIIYETKDARVRHQNEKRREIGAERAADHFPPCPTIGAYHLR
jgi:hypothetical protein